MPFLTHRETNLKDSGPILEVVIVPPQPVSDLLLNEGRPVPQLKVMALIDTGAALTCINQSIVNALNLIPFDIQSIHTAAGISQQLLYDIGIILPISRPNVLSLQAPCANLSGQPFQVLLGRDVLSMCSLFYNGVDNSFTLHF